MSGTTLKIGNEDVEIVPGFLSKVPLDGSNVTNKQKADIKIAMSSKKLPLQLADTYGGTDASGKLYPGRINFFEMRALARYSTVVRAIVIMRTQQVSKLPIKIVPKKKEPIRQTSILKYSPYDLESIPAFDEDDVVFLRDIFDRVDEDGVIADKRKKFNELKGTGEFSPKELAAVEHLQDKHDAFYQKRTKDVRAIEKILSRPDPWFTESPTWNSLVNKILEDVLILDRGAIVKIRDVEGNLIGLMPVDGSSIKPVNNEFGFLDDEKAYVQNINGVARRYLSKKDVIILMMNPVTDMRYFGYGISPMETLYYAVLSDLFIDKGNMDYYRKGGSIPEGMIAIEPPSSKDGIINQLDQEQLEAIQRQLTSIIAGDFTQVPIVTGGKISWIDFKGSRRDMQFQELADYLVKKICAVLQVSPQDVGMLEGFKTSDGEVQAEMTKSKGLQTIMSTLSEYISEAVIPEIRPECDLKLWYEEPEDKEADKQWGTQNKLQAGFISVNEARAEKGLPPVPWGNTPLAAGNQKNWNLENPDGAPGAPGAPGAGGLPSLPGLPPPPGAGAPSPGAGAPPPPGEPPVMKSYLEQLFDGVEEVQRNYFSDVDLTPATDIYMKGARIPDDDILEEIAQYKPSTQYRQPIDSYNLLLKGIHSPLVIDQKLFEEDTLLFSRLVGDKIVIDKKGDTPILRTIAKSISDDGDEEAVEWALLERLGDETQNKLEKFYYNNLTKGVTQNQINAAKDKYNI